MLAKELIDRLERLGLLDQEIIEALREQLEQGGTRVTPEAVAKLLVDNGQLTHFQATKLIGELRSGEYVDGAEEAELTAGVVGEELGIVPDEAEIVEAVVEADPIEVFEAEPVDAVPVEATPVAVEAVPAAATPVSVADAMTDGGDQVATRPRNVSRKMPDPEKSTWDSFKIYGYLGIIVLLALAGGLFAWVLTREDADKHNERAEEFYENQNYESAQEAYKSFLDRFGDNHEYSSIARTRIAMTQLYKASQFRNEPGRALEIEETQLPLIAKENEGGLNQERNNLSQLLVDVAKNIANTAVEEKETEKKRVLLSQLDQQIAYTENPIYVTGTARATLSGQIDEVMEARKRVERDINRNVSLDEAVAEMGTALDSKDTKAAYDIRKRLLRAYPELYDDERLVNLIRNASGIQQTLVKSSSDVPDVLTEPAAADSIRQIVLTALTGSEVPDLRGVTLYLRAGGSVLAIDGENGSLKWRKFVGFAKDLPPLRLAEGAGVVLSESTTLEVLRCAAEDGEVQWRSQINEPFSQPIGVDDEIYVATNPGRLIKLDADSGDADWVTQIPQPLEVGPGVDDRRGRVYVPGNHSNLYVVNSRDGSCIESFYIGHSEGTVVVPPIPLLGHVFVIENAGVDFVNVHVLKVNDQGEQLEVAQPLFRLEGNVTVEPIIQGRRLILLTDRGEVAVYDIEPTAENDKVTLAARGARFYEKPTATRMAVEGSQMWIAGASIGRYRLQINTGQVVRDWDNHALDTFIGTPFASDEALVYARILRDTSTIRVTAANPKTGNEIWRTDVGVPVSMIRAAPGKGVHVVTSQAALYLLDQQALENGSTEGPIENPGDKAILIRFAKPLTIDDSRSLMLNQSASDKILVYEPARPRELIRQVTLNLSGGKPSGGPIVAGDGLFMPLSSGRAVLVDWRTGKNMSSPFQPASDPAKEVTWTLPARLPTDKDQIVIADSRRKIYRLRIGDQLRALATKDLEFQLLGPTAGVGNTYFGSFAGPSADFVAGYDLNSLDEKFRTLLGGRIVWGPVAADKHGFLKTDDGMLRAFGEDGQQKFELALPDGEPIGEPVQVGDSVVLAGSTGWLIKIDSSGKITGNADLGEPISATPYYTGNSLLVPGAEGVVYIVDVP